MHKMAEGKKKYTLEGLEQNIDEAIESYKTTEELLKQEGCIR